MFSILSILILLETVLALQYPAIHRPKPNSPIEECKLATHDQTKPISEAINDPEIRDSLAPTKGTLKGALIYIDFPDAAGTNYTPDLSVDLFDPVGEWFSKASMGRLNITMEVERKTWYRMPKSSQEYLTKDNTWDSMLAIKHDLLEILGPRSPFQYDDILYVVPTYNARHMNRLKGFMPIDLDKGVNVPDIIIVNNDADPEIRRRAVIRETLHTMGLPDLSSGLGTSGEDPIGNFDMMAGNDGWSEELLGWHRWKIGWIDDDQVDCRVSLGQSLHSLSPIETEGGTKMIVSKFNETSAVVFEIRSTRGVDGNDCTGGLLQYMVHTNGSPDGPLPLIKILNLYTSTAPCEVDANLGKKVHASPKDGSKDKRLIKSDSLGMFANINPAKTKDETYEIEKTWWKKCQPKSQLDMNGEGIEPNEMWKNSAWGFEKEDEWCLYNVPDNSAGAY